MPRFYSALSFFIILVTLSFGSENYKQIKLFIDANQIQSVSDLGISLEGSYKFKAGEVILFVSDNEYKLLTNSGYRTEVLIDNWKVHFAQREEFSDAEKTFQLNKTSAKYGVQNFEFGSMAGFYTLDEINAKIGELYDYYPNLVGDVYSIGQTEEGRDIYVFKVSVNPNVDEDEPEVLYTAMHHAREPEGMMQLFYFVQYLLDNYETNDEVNYLLNNRELYFIPVVNPDGYYYNETTDPNGGGYWRKNRSDNGDSTYGVDLNRNYGPMEYWDAPNGGSSTDTYSATYRGEEPFSELENQAIRTFLNNHEIKACLNYHTYSNLLIFPYGALEKETPDSNIFREFGEDMTVKNNYSVGTDMQTVNYSTRGGSDDYMYDGEPGRDKIFAMTPEVGNFRDGFWPTQYRIIPLAEENLFPNLYYANIVGSYPSVVNIIIDNGHHQPSANIYPGESFNLMPIIRNKGLKDSGEFEVKITSLSDGASIVSDNAIILEGLEAQTSFSTQDYFIIDLDENVDSATDLFLKFDIVENGLLRRSDTLKVKVGYPVTLFEDNADSLNQFWSSQGEYKKWEKTSRYSYSGTYSYTDSKGSWYESSEKTTLTLNDEIDLNGLNNAFLYFQTRYHIESDFDGGYIEISTDNGSSWNVVGGHFAKPAENYFDSDDIAAGEPIYSGGMFSWKEEEINLEDYLGENILIRFTFYSDGGTEIDGWYLDDIKVVAYGISTDVNTHKLEYSYSLAQNYPNPFNPTTKINYEIAEMGEVTIKVYDALGREVKTLVNSIQSPGNYSVNFDAKSGFSSGIYFYRLESGPFSQTRKMLLLK